MDEVSKDVCEVRYTHTQKRLDEHDKSIDSLSECVQRLTVLAESTNERSKDVNERLTRLERKPGDIFEKIAIGVISTITTFIITYFLSRGV